MNRFDAIELLHQRLTERVTRKRPVLILGQDNQIDRSVGQAEGVSIWLPTRDPLDQFRLAVDGVKDLFPILDFGFRDAVIALVASENHYASSHDGTYRGAFRMPEAGQIAIA